MTDGETNASLRKGDTIEGLSAERAVELLAERRAAGPSVRRARATKKAAKKVAKTARKTVGKTAAKTPAKTAAKKVANKRA